MNTGVQRSGRLRRRRDGDHEGDRGRAGQRVRPGQDALLIAVAHGILYVATATVAELEDLEAKVERALELHGARYLHVLVPCPLGWGSAARTRSGPRASPRKRPSFPSSRPRTERSRASPDPPTASGRGLPAAAAPRRASLPRRRPARPGGPDPGAGRPQRRALRAPGRPGGGSRMNDKPFANPLDVGSSLANKTGSWRTSARSMSTSSRHAPRPARPARTSKLALRGGVGRRRLPPGLGEARRGQSVSGRDGQSLLPPLRVGLQPGRARSGGGHQLRRALDRRSRDREGLAVPPPGPADGEARAHRRCRPVRPVGRIPPRPARAFGDH